MFKPNHDSFYKKYANKSIDWIPSDTKDLYEKNLKENYQLLKNYNWIDKSFTYKFNSHGFRCEEFTADPTIMFLGCSYTFGTGVPSNTSWPEILAKELNMHCANLGQGGGASDTMFRLCHGWIDVIKPKIVFALHPPGIRFEMINEFQVEYLSPTWGFKQRTFITEWSKDDNNHYFNTLKNNLAIENLCNTRNIKFVSVEIEKRQFFNLDKARDLVHPGIVSHNLFAKSVFNLI
jgi:hypothetical protein